MASVRAALLNALLTCTMVALLFGAWWWRYEVYRGTGRTHYLIEASEFPDLTEAQMVQLGWAHLAGAGKSSSYTSFSKAKSPAKTRIGYFGCSFTEGYGIKDGLDPAAQLGKILGRDFEVLNFGVSYYGLHQSFLLWRDLAESFHLDTAVFFPWRFHIPRDQNFVYPRGKSALTMEAPHALFRADGGKLFTEEVLGRSRQEAMEKFYGFPPSLHYLRQNGLLMPQVAAIWPSKFANMQNPLAASREDTVQTYVLMFQEVARKMRLIVVCSSPEIRKICERAKQGSPQIECMPDPNRGLFGNFSYLHAYDGHPNFLLAYNQANGIAEYLGHGNSQSPRQLRLAPSLARISNHRVDRLSVWLNRQIRFPVVPLAEHSLRNLPPLTEPNAGIGEAGDRFIYGWQDHRSDLLFWALPNALLPNSPLEIRVERGSEVLRLPLELRGSSILAAYEKTLSHGWLRLGSCTFTLAEFPSVHTNGKCEELRGGILQGGERLAGLVRAPGHSYFFAAAGKSWLVPRSDEKTGADLSRFPGEGDIELEIGSGASSVFVPAGKFYFAKKGTAKGRGR